MAFTKAMSSQCRSPGSVAGESSMSLQQHWCSAKIAVAAVACIWQCMLCLMRKGFQMYSWLWRLHTKINVSCIAQTLH